MKFLTIILFVLAFVLAVLTITAAVSFGNEYGYERTFVGVALIGLVLTLIPLLIGAWLLQRCRRR